MPVSNSPDPLGDVHYLTHIGRRAACQLLNIFGEAANIRSVISSNAPGSGMMRPNMLSALLRAGNFSAGQSLLVSDHPLELSAARDLGLPAVALGYGRAPATMLAGYEPVAVAAHCGELARVLHLYCDSRPHGHVQ